MSASHKVNFAVNPNTKGKNLKALPVFMKTPCVDMDDFFLDKEFGLSRILTSNSDYMDRISEMSSDDLKRFKLELEVELLWMIEIIDFCKKNEFVENTAMREELMRRAWLTKGFCE